MSAVAAVSWALIGMAGTAALGLRLLGADAAGPLGPMTAAVVALGAGGSVTPSGDVSVFGLSAADADTAIEITPLGVSLAGALLLSRFFLRSLRAAGVVVSAAELSARAGAVVALFVLMLGGLAWAGRDVITIDGGSLGLDGLTGDGGGGGVELPGLGDIGGLPQGRLGDLADARAAVGFTVDTVPTLLGGLGWSAGILLIALLASRRTPLPRGCDALHRIVRPAVSAVVMLVAVAAGLAAAVYAAIGDDRPQRIAGAALLGAPNGVWLGVAIGLLVPWDGRATGELTRLLPAPLDELLAVASGPPVTLDRLAEFDKRVWLLGVAAALMMLLAGVLVGVRTPAGGRCGVGPLTAGGTRERARLRRRAGTGCPRFRRPVRAAAGRRDRRRTAAAGLADGHVGDRLPVRARLRRVRRGHRVARPSGHGAAAGGGVGRRGRGCRGAARVGERGGGAVRGGVGTARRGCATVCGGVGPARRGERSRWDGEPGGRRGDRCGVGHRVDRCGPGRRVHGGEGRWRRAVRL